MKPAHLMSVQIACVFVLLCAWFQIEAADRGKAPEVEPDYTRGENPSGECDTPWALGPTGAFGNIWRGDQHMIQVVKIDEGTPAFGKLSELDVIIGVVSPKLTPPVDAGNRFTLGSPQSAFCGHHRSGKG